LGIVGPTPGGGSLGVEAVAAELRARAALAAEARRQAAVLAGKAPGEIRDLQQRLRRLGRAYDTAAAQMEKIARELARAEVEADAGHALVLGRLLPA